MELLATCKLLGRLMGWPRDRVLVIDEDQGQSAQSAARWFGFAIEAATVWSAKPPRDRTAVAVKAVPAKRPIQ
jgi:hypothetical protein